MKQLTPLYNRVLLTPTPALVRTPGGLYIPESAQEKSDLATVYKLGTGGIDSKGNVIDFYVKEGDKVLVKQHTGTPLTVDGEKRLLVSESDILAIVLP